ncbi:hypothetical protein MNAN1_001937 [Malassezia nana]|uniref:Uncharacterized protein n=1 Tax=Malassezia nana TaxID=180528 RepID=A0AAF0J3K9_9BASI|nr:hypothetical protein MNAN1_001937 [Malassezia nana]
MVLQNKYKARASRRYKAAKGITDTPKKRDEPIIEQERNQAGPEGDFAETTEVHETPSIRRALQSNNWRYEESDTDEEAEPEPEIDTTGLQEKVLALDINARVLGQVSDSESEDESDEAWNDPFSRKAQLRALSSVDWEDMQREKLDSEAARDLKERFLHQTRAGSARATWRRVDGSQVSVKHKPRKNQEPSKAPPPRVRAADTVHSAQGGKASVRFVPRPTAAQTGSSAQDIDDFLRDIQSSESAKAQSMNHTPKISAAPMKNDMQDFLDDLLG